MYTYTHTYPSTNIQIHVCIEHIYLEALSPAGAHSRTVSQCQQLLHAAAIQSMWTLIFIQHHLRDSAVSTIMDSVRWSTFLPQQNVFPSPPGNHFRRKAGSAVGMCDRTHRRSRICITTISSTPAPSKFCTFTYIQICQRKTKGATSVTTVALATCQRQHTLEGNAPLYDLHFGILPWLLQSS